jgi:hypothetical protein
MSAKDREEPRELHPKVLVEKIERYAEPCIAYFKAAPDDAIEKRFYVPFGAGGQRIFQHRLRELVHEKYSTFVPAGYEEDLRKFDAVRRSEADGKVRDIVEAVHRFVITKLTQVYGEKDNYLSLAVENKEILKKAFDKQIDADNDKQKDLGTYLDFIDLRKIVETPKNWPHFKDNLSIQLSDENNGRAKYVRWFDEINKLRRVAAHPYNRGYDDYELETIRLIYSRLTEHAVLTG